MLKQDLKFVKPTKDTFEVRLVIRTFATDRALLRLGLYEIKYFEETPGRVAVNEIIEIAKKYSDDTSAKFVNGLLSQFVVE